MGEVTNLASGGGVGSLNNCLIFGLYYKLGWFTNLASGGETTVYIFSGFTINAHQVTWRWLCRGSCLALIDSKEFSKKGIVKNGEGLPSRLKRRGSSPKNLMKCMTTAGSGTRFILLLSLLIFGLQICGADDGIHKDNIVVILDASGSMHDKFSGDLTKSKMEAAKAALQEVLAKVPDDTRIGLLVFSGANIQNEWVYPLGEKDTQKLIAAIDLPQPSGNTPLGKYIRIGANRLLEQREQQYNYGNYRLLVVTDGEASDGDKVKHYTPEILNRQIRIDVIGVDMKTDHMLANVVDSYRKADNPGELVAAVSQILAETGDTGTDVSGEDVFEYITPLSSEIAADLIQRLTTPPSNTAITVKPMGVTPSQTTTPIKTPTPQRRDAENQSGIWLVILLVALSVIGFLVFRNRK